MMIKKNIISIYLVLLCLSNFAQKKDINRISKEQKVYELSYVWKELSYNFDNMDNCPNVNLDSLYQAYMPIAQNTKNDLEYCKTIERFLAHFNNGHTDIFDIPFYLYPYVARPYIKTAYKDGKIIIENIGRQYKDKLNIGEEILTINGINAITYFKTYYVPYVCASNEETKIYKSMFSVGPPHLMLKGTKIKLGIKTSNGIKNVDIYADKDLLDTTNNWLIENIGNLKNNQFYFDTVNSFAYLHLLSYNKHTPEYFFSNIDAIHHSNYLIIDLSDNIGGSFDFNDSIIQYLIDEDSISSFHVKTRVNCAAYKAMGERICNNPSYKDYDYYKLYCDYYHSNVFESMYGQKYKNLMDSIYRYKGRIYVIINSNTGSAAEGFVIVLSQAKNVTFLGQKTAGATGQPLGISLPSGLLVRINTKKTYDFQNRNVSSGFSPDYEYDFSDFYKTSDPKELLSRFIKVFRVLNEKN